MLFLPFQSVSDMQRTRNRCDIEILWEIRRKVQKNEGVYCAIGGRTGTHSVKIGPDMHCCPTDRLIACLHFLLFHYRSGAMRTELGDQQYYTLAATCPSVYSTKCII